MKKIKYVILIFWIVLIFCFSSQVAEKSQNSSRDLSNKVLYFISEVNPNYKGNQEFLNKNLRKLAHVFNYMILGIVFSLVMYSRGKSTLEMLLFSLIFCFMIASIDEYYQNFVHGRDGKIQDVMVDMIGSTIGSVLAFFVTIKNKQKFY